LKEVDRNGKEIMYDLENKINMAVFPGLQGGPHNHAIAGIAVAMKHATTQEFKQYQRQVVQNAQALAKGLSDLGYKIVTGGTDNHIVHVDLRSSPGKLSGAKGELILEQVNISCNKNTVPGDMSAMNPSGIRLGSPSLTTRGLKEVDMMTVVDFIHGALQLAVNIQTASGPKLVDFKAKLKTEEFSSQVQALRTKVEQFAVNFRLPGHDDI
jgi:glycine hydroxymethyltransferase